jgi:Hemerythrin HHE cation binding domain
MRAVPRAGDGDGLCQAWGHRYGRSLLLLPVPDRMAALSEQLVHVHQTLREQLTSLRREAVGSTGHRAANTAVGEDLLSHCLSFCTAIHTHHTGEDSKLLPARLAGAPELTPMIGNLTEDHALVTGILRQIRELLTPGSGSFRPRRARTRTRRAHRDPRVALQL